jgi:hypothetical protein
VGNQTVKLYYDGDPLRTLIYIDEVAKPQNTNWTYVSGNGFTAMGIDDSWTFSPETGFTVIGATSSVSFHYYWEPMPLPPRGSDFNPQGNNPQVTDFPQGRNFNIVLFVIGNVILIAVVVVVAFLVTRKIRRRKNSY